MNTRVSKGDVLEFLKSECGLDSETIDDNTALFSSNLMDSLDLLDLVSFLEEKYDLKISSMEVGLDSLDTIAKVMAFVEKKLAGP